MLLMVGLMVFALVGCGEQEGTEDADNTEQTVTEDNEQEVIAPESKYPFPETVTEQGEGIVIVRTPSGDSANNNVPFEIVQSDVSLTQIGYDLEDWDSSKEVFVYINKVFYEAVQSGGRYQGSLNLQGDLLKPGEYTVSAIQFEGNEPTGAVVSYKEAKYEVEEGH